MNEFNFNKFIIRITGKIPRTIDQLSKRQFIRVASALFSADSLEIPKKIFILLQFLNVRWWSLRMKYNLLWLDDDQALELSHYADFLFTTGLKTDCCLINKFWHKGSFYHGPWQKFTNITFGKFVETSDYLQLYQKNNDNDLLIKFVAVLYKLSNDMGQKGFQKRIIALTSMDPAVRIAIFYNWLLMLNYLHSLFPYVFSRKVGGTSSVLWIDVVSEWSGHNPVDDDSKYAKPMLQVLHALDRLNKSNLRTDSSRAVHKK